MKYAPVSTLFTDIYIQPANKSRHGKQGDPDLKTETPRSWMHTDRQNGYVPAISGLNFAYRLI